MACLHLPTLHCDECWPIYVTQQPFLPIPYPFYPVPEFEPITKIKRGSCVEDTDGNIHVFDGKKWRIAKEETDGPGTL